MNHYWAFRTGRDPVRSQQTSTIWLSFPGCHDNVITTPYHCLIVKFLLPLYADVVDRHARSLDVHYVGSLGIYTFVIVVFDRPAPWSYTKTFMINYQEEIKIRNPELTIVYPDQQSLRKRTWPDLINAAENEIDHDIWKSDSSLNDAEEGNAKRVIRIIRTKGSVRLPITRLSVVVEHY